MRGRRKITPKGCNVRHIELTDTGADVRMDCPKGFVEGGERFYRKRITIVSNRVTRIRIPGAAVTRRGARVDFVVSPKQATCWREGSTIDCKVK